MAIVSQDLTLHVEQLTVAVGEIDEVHSAALRDLADSVKRHVEMNWPKDTWTSFEGWRIVRTGTVDYAIMNQVPYTGHVWNNVSDSLKPDGVGLAYPLIEEGVAIVSADVEAFLSARVTSLLVP